MDAFGMIRLLQTVAVNYPSFKKHIEAENGGISKFVVNEWERVLGFLSYEEALNRLDDYMAGENGSRIPKPMDLRNIKRAKADDIFHAPIPHKWHLEFQPSDHEHKHGRLRDQEEYEYVHDPTYEDGYHYDSMGRICDIQGHVLFV